MTVIRTLQLINMHDENGFLPLLYMVCVCIVLLQWACNMSGRWSRVVQYLSLNVMLDLFMSLSFLIMYYYFYACIVFPVYYYNYNGM